MDVGTKTAATVLGAVFVIVGVLGFIPNPLVSATGIFVVNTAHNLVHLVSGAVLLGAALSWGKAKLTLQVLGVVYAVVALLGFVTSGNMLLGIIHSNTADTWLHVVLAIVLLAAGFALPDDQTATA